MILPKVKIFLMMFQVELVLPKQVCRELLYGYAEKPVHQYAHTEPPVRTHSSKIKYGPKIQKKLETHEQSATSRQIDVSKIPDTYTVNAPEKRI